MSLAQSFGHQLGLPSIPNFTPIVFVVDEDISVRASLELLIRSEGWQPETFASAQEFLARATTARSELPDSCCLSSRSKQVSKRKSGSRARARKCRSLSFPTMEIFHQLFKQ